MEDSIDQEMSRDIVNLEPPLIPVPQKLLKGMGRHKSKLDQADKGKQKVAGMDVGKIILKKPGRPSLKQKGESEIMLGIEEGLEGGHMEQDQDIFPASSAPQF